MYIYTNLISLPLPLLLPNPTTNTAPSKCQALDWDSAIKEANRCYSKKVHNIVTENCHHHIGIYLSLSMCVYIYKYINIYIFLYILTSLSLSRHST